MSVSSGRSSSGGAASRGRSSSGTRGRSSAQSSSGAKRSQARKNTAQKSASGSTGSGSANRKTTARKPSDSRNGSGANQSAGGAIARVGVPVVTGAAGIAGGILLGRNALQRNRKMLGFQMPSKIDLGGVTQQIAEAGKQFGKLAGEVRNVAVEVRAVRTKAEEIGKILS